MGANDTRRTGPRSAGASCGRRSITERRPTMSSTRTCGRCRPADVVFSFREMELSESPRRYAVGGASATGSRSQARSLRGPSASRRLVPVLGRRKREHAASHPARRGADLDIRAGESEPGVGCGHFQRQSKFRLGVMARTTRRQFVEQAALAAAGLYGGGTLVCASEWCAPETVRQNPPKVDAATIRTFAASIAGQVITSRGV